MGNPLNPPTWFLGGQNVGGQKFKKLCEGA